MSNNNFDLAVIGGGIGGYSTAIYAAKKGLKVALIEQSELGGTCLNKGCIPTKALLKSSENYQLIKNASDWGVEGTGEVQLNYLTVHNQMEQVVNQLRSGVTFLMKKNQISVFNGTGRIQGSSIFSPNGGAIAVDMGDKDEMIVPKNIVIATGSRPKNLPNIVIDETNILSSDGLLQLTELPKSLAIIGGGVIGVEMASLLNNFGVAVTIIEYGNQLLPNEHPKLAKLLKKQFEQRGINIYLSAEVTAVSNNQVEITKGETGEKINLPVEKVLVSVGRCANVEDVGLESMSIRHDQKGIQVNQYYQTSQPTIYAIGDVIPGIQLAHVAVREGQIAVDHLLGKNPKLLDEKLIPKCVYTQPELASIGVPYAQIKKMKKDTLTGTGRFMANGKALIERETEGFVEIIAEKETEDILYIGMIGPHVTELIAEASLGMNMDGSPEEFMDAIHPHPSLSESMVEAAADIYNLSINQ
ncbi:dihydrolipoyl dehydrogenase [Vagococcus humatus]|uniref:Dihydrolipoyl dehydrogenase n=1 Tax=Vagococcus humatus TaxID=1889241 RepID=A0A429Z5A7_9ENTE|nr:dihydrolipoyl dehydrogenase [Vagococcus humatus]RST88891.1 dihydrolipoyl dehydrogenase [Vagococcus humatus]